jgi:hypothetical protein
MAFRFSIRRLFLLTAVIAYALGVYLEAAKWSSYQRDETVFPVTPLPPSAR